MRPLIRPFTALHPRTEHAAAVAAPPYDVLSSDEARVRAAGKPHSFLHISKAEIDQLRGQAPDADADIDKMLAFLAGAERGIVR